MHDAPLIQRAVTRVAEQRIREAMEQGKFAQLTGHGQPIANIDQRYDLTHWVRDWLKRHDIAPLTPGSIPRELNALVKERNAQRTP